MIGKFPKVLDPKQTLVDLINASNPTFQALTKDLVTFGDPVKTTGPDAYTILATFAAGYIKTGTFTFTYDKTNVSDIVSKAGNPPLNLPHSAVIRVHSILPKLELYYGIKFIPSEWVDGPLTQVPDQLGTYTFTLTPSASNLLWHSAVLVTTTREVAVEDASVNYPVVGSVDNQLWFTRSVEPVDPEAVVNYPLKGEAGGIELFGNHMALAVNNSNGRLFKIRSKDFIKGVTAAIPAGARPTPGIEYYSTNWNAAANGNYFGSVMTIHRKWGLELIYPNAVDSPKATWLWLHIDHVGGFADLNSYTILPLLAEQFNINLSENDVVFEAGVVTNGYVDVNVVAQAGSNLWTGGFRVITAVDNAIIPANPALSTLVTDVTLDSLLFNANITYTSGPVGFNLTDCDTEAELISKLITRNPGLAAVSDSALLLKDFKISRTSNSLDNPLVAGPCAANLFIAPSMRAVGKVRFTFKQRSLFALGIAARPYVSESFSDGGTSIGILEVDPTAFIFPGSAALTVANLLQLVNVKYNTNFNSKDFTVDLIDVLGTRYYDIKPIYSVGWCNFLRVKAITPV